MARRVRSFVGHELPPLLAQEHGASIVRCAAAVDVKVCPDEQWYLEAVVYVLRRHGRASRVSACDVEEELLALRVARPFNFSGGSRTLVQLLQKFPHLVTVKGPSVAPMVTLSPAGISAAQQGLGASLPVCSGRSAADVLAAEKRFMKSVVDVLRIRNTCRAGKLAEALTAAGVKRPRGSGSFLRLLRRHGDIVELEDYADAKEIHVTLLDKYAASVKVDACSV